MTNTRTVEVFSAGCPACTKTAKLVERLACSSCDVTILDMNHDAVARRAEELGIRRVPAVVIDGVLAECCSGDSPNEETLRAAGLGVTLG